MNNSDLTIEQVIDAVRKSQSIYKFKQMNEDSLLEKDLGITGDDGVDLLADLENVFYVRFESSDFDLAENEFLFHSEGFNPLSVILSYFFENKTNVKPISIGLLFAALTKAKQRLNSAKHQIPNAVA